MYSVSEEPQYDSTYEEESHVGFTSAVQSVEPTAATTEARYKHPESEYVFVVIMVVVTSAKAEGRARAATNAEVEKDFMVVEICDARAQTKAGGGAREDNPQQQGWKGK